MSTVPKIGSAELEHMLHKAQDAHAVGPGTLSTGERLVVALILNRPDWLAEVDYTIAEAIERVGPEWMRLVPAAAKQFERSRQEAAYAAAEDARQAKLADAAGLRADSDVVHFAASLVTWGDAPGYRDVHLTFDLRPVGEPQRPTLRAELRLRPEDGETIVRHITQVHRFAWEGDGPIDTKPGEQRPRWISGAA
ncbi:MAG: hypothetical protein ACRC67_16545 [Inquilinus sp.]|uniref:hypothetical protein n=1 Tax=Inquilinus sp. TaxID=1932117 RepID=UPI003F3E0323